MKSLLQLTQALVEMGRLTQAFSAKEYPKIKQPEVFTRDYRMSDETYGSKSFVYLQTSLADRGEVEGFLRSKGFKVSSTYNTIGIVSEIQVNRFKGWHHNE